MLLLISELKQIISALESLIELWHPPWSNDFDLGLQSIESKLETDLIIAFACAAMGDELASFLLSNGYLRSGNDWACERGAEEVDVLVTGIALDCREAELMDELVDDILDVAFFGTDLHGLRLCSFEVLLLPNVRHEADDIVAFLDQPGEDTRSVETAGVGEADSLFFSHVGRDKGRTEWQTGEGSGKSFSLYGRHRAQGRVFKQLVVESALGGD